MTGLTRTAVRSTLARHPRNVRLDRADWTLEDWRRQWRRTRRLIATAEWVAAFGLTTFIAYMLLRAVL